MIDKKLIILTLLKEKNFTIGLIDICTYELSKSIINENINIYLNFNFFKISNIGVFCNSRYKYLAIDDFKSVKDIIKEIDNIIQSLLEDEQ